MDYQNYYLTTYLFSAFVAFLFAINYNIKGRKEVSLNVFLVLVFAFTYALVFGFRDYSIGSDTQVYVKDFKYNNISEAKDVGFAILIKITSIFTNERGFFVVVAFLYLSFLSLVFYFFDKTKMYIMFFMFTSMFFFETFGVNVMRNGLASILLLLSIMFFLRNKKIIASMLLIIASSFHASIITPFLFWIIAKKVRSLKLIYGIFFATIILSYLGFGINSITDVIPMLNIFFKDRFDTYFENPDWLDYQIGFKASFVMFNLVFALIGYKLYSNIEDIVKKEKYGRFLRTFLFSSSFFFMSFYVSFSDRVGALSWIFIPFLLEPLLDKYRYKYGAIISVLLCFFIFVFFYNTVRTI